MRIGCVELDNKNQNNNGNDRVEIDQQFLDMLAGKFTAKQLGQDKPDPVKAATSLATMLSQFYKELRRGGVPRELSFSLTQMLLNLTMSH